MSKSTTKRKYTRRAPAVKRRRRSPANPIVGGHRVSRTLAVLETAAANENILEAWNRAAKADTFLTVNRTSAKKPLLTGGGYPVDPVIAFAWAAAAKPAWKLAA